MAKVSATAKSAAKANFTAEEQMAQRAHDTLSKGCPWYKAVNEGGNHPDPASHCGFPKDFKSPSPQAGALVKFTPRTPEASTVVKPTVPPGGPGLFHIKGMHLPPYMEHLWFHLVKEYGEHKAYQVANGVVHKWAQGINPGGKHPTKTHPDVRAAAQKNIAEWEKDKAQAHEHAKATVTLSSQSAQNNQNLDEHVVSYMRRDSRTGRPELVHQFIRRHRFCPVCLQQVEEAHAAAHAKAHEKAHNTASATAKETIARERALRGEHFHARPANLGRERNVRPLEKHGSTAALANEVTSDLGVAHFPGDELHKILPVPPEKTAKAMFTAHRIDETINELAHTLERLGAARKMKDPGDRDYHMKHVANHLTHALQAAHMLADNFRDNYPPEGGELDAMSRVMGLAKALSGDAKVATTAHLLQTILYDETHAKRHADVMVDKPGTPELWNFNADHCEKHVKGAMSHALKLATHITDNYPAEARWLRALQDAEGPRGSTVRLAARAAVPKGQPAGVGKTGEVWSAPGAKMVDPATKISAQLKHVPSQTVVPSPPTPPGSELPTPAECDALAAVIEKDNPDKNSILTGAVNQLRDAGHKFSKNEVVHALNSLRSAQMGILAGHYELRRNSIPQANVFVAAQVPPAAAVSAHAAMAQSVKDREKFRAHYVAISKLIDRTRRHWFHGMYGGYAQARFSDRQALEEAIIAASPQVD